MPFAIQIKKKQIWCHMIYIPHMGLSNSVNLGIVH